MHILGTGKYSRWASTLDIKTLEALLWTIGVFGSGIRALKAHCKEFPKFSFSDHEMSEERMRNAIEFIAVVEETGKLDLRMPSGWDRRFVFLTSQIAKYFSKL